MRSHRILDILGTLYFLGGIIALIAALVLLVTAFGQVNLLGALWQAFATLMVGLTLLGISQLIILWFEIREQGKITLERLARIEALLARPAPPKAPRVTEPGAPIPPH